MRSCVIISGGRLDMQFALTFVKKEQPEFLITADKGLAFCKEQGILPTHIVGDFDTLGKALLPEYANLGIPIHQYDPVKDYTDTEIAIRLAMELGAEKIQILGASEGNRLDHLFGNVQSMITCAKSGVECYMVDLHNRIRIVTKDINISRKEQYGKYISLIPLTTEVTGVTLTGFKYPLQDYRFVVGETGSLGISNELAEEDGRICLKDGILLMLECSD